MDAQTAPAQPNVPAEDVPWYAAYPEPRSEPKSITRQEVLQMLKRGTRSRTDFVTIDLRLADHEGGTILGSINLPAQSLFPTIPSLYELFKAGGVRDLIWFCGSSEHRGKRAAGWFADYIDEKRDNTMQSLVLTGGIKAWAGEKGEFVQCMQDYDESKWP